MSLANHLLCGDCGCEPVQVGEPMDFLIEAKDFLKAWALAFVSVWILLLVPVLSAIGRGLLFLAALGERYLDSNIQRPEIVEVEFALKFPASGVRHMITGELTDTPFVCEKHGKQPGSVFIDGFSSQALCLICMSNLERYNG